MYTDISEFISNDGHILGDFYLLLTGIDARGIIWLFTMFAIVILDFLWVYKDSELTKNLRIANWIIALIVYAGYTLFFPLSPNYDYFIYMYILKSNGWPISITILMLLSILMMWFGVILADGYFIYMILDEKGSSKKNYILTLMSLGIPSAGHLIIKKYNKGLIYLIITPIIWFIGLFTFYIPTLLFWIYVAYDVNKN